MCDRRRGDVGEVARGLGHEQEPEPAGERPVLGGTRRLVTQAGQQVAGERVIDHGEGGHPAHPTWVRGPFACHCGVASGIMAGDMERFFAYWFTYFGPDPG